MSTPISNYSDLRCVTPGAKTTGEPWFRMPDTCPCDTKFTNITGRGYQACPFGVTLNPAKSEYITLDINVPFGANYPLNSYVAPQLQPRQLIRIGNTWRY